MSHAVFAVPNMTQGRLFVMPCPPADALVETISGLRAQGVTTVLSMLAPQEATLLGMAQEADACRAQGIQFMMHPIADFGLPDMDTFGDLIRDIIRLLKSGEHIAVHCRAGIGRSGMVAACILIAQGQCSQDAVANVSAARGVSIPDTVEQGSFIASFEKSAKSVGGLSN